MEQILQKLDGMQKHIDILTDKVSVSEEFMKNYKECSSELILTKQKLHNMMDSNKQKDDVIQNKDGIIQEKDNIIQRKDEELRGIRGDLYQKGEELNQLKINLQNPSKKGQMFENQGVEPILAEICERIPGCKLHFTAKEKNSGDFIIEYGEKKFQLNHDAKNYSETSILTKHIEQSIRDTKNRNSDACIIVYKELPGYVLKECPGGIYDMATDIKNKFPLNIEDFDKNNMIICTPDTLQSAFFILLIRHIETTGKFYKLTTEKYELQKDLVDLLHHQADILYPFLSNNNAEKLNNISKLAGQIGYKIAHQCKNTLNCDDKQVDIQSSIQKLIGKIGSIEKEKGKSGSHIPHLFMSDYKPPAKEKPTSKKKTLEKVDEEPRKRQKLEETGLTDNEDR